MSRTRYAVVDSTNLEVLLNLTAALAEALPEDANAERTVNAVQSMREILVEYESPFLARRKELLARRELQDLVMFLFGGGRASFFHIFSSLTPAEVQIALGCIAHYSTHGETDRDFMRLASEIHDLQKAAA